jgi:hypothetical protein
MKRRSGQPPADLVEFCTAEHDGLVRFLASTADSLPWPKNSPMKLSSAVGDGYVWVTGNEVLYRVRAAL